MSGQHTENNPLGGAIVDNGEWADGSRWTLALLDELPPSFDPAECTSVGGVVIRNLDSREMMLTYTPAGRAPDYTPQWEIPGGHVDRLDPHDNNPKGPRETPSQALVREIKEETGLQVDEAHLHFFAYRTIINDPSSRAVTQLGYPELSFNLFSWMLANGDPGMPTDPEEQPAAGTFTLDSMKVLARKRAMPECDLVIVKRGLEAALYDLRGITAAL